MASAAFGRTGRRFRFRGGTARVGNWRGRADVAALDVRGALPPPAGVVDRMLDTLRASGYLRVVTGALAPEHAGAFVDAGFGLEDQLVLFEHDLEGVGRRGSRGGRRVARRERPAVLALDGRAFDPFWRLGPPDLRAALAATPHARFRAEGPRHRPVGYCITGRAGTQGYVQRLAVDPDERRRGVATLLLGDGLSWLRRHGARRVLVNTPVGNEAARRLYRACGFRPLPDGLLVLGRPL